MAPPMSIAQQPEEILPSDLVLARLRQLHPRKIDLSLERIENLLRRLGHPEKDFPPVFHIAGTNGKGSTLAFVRAAMERAGHRVHVYTSPHLVRFNERIRLAGELITDAHLQDVLEACERVNNGEAITEFEVVTAAAFLAFRDVAADFLLLETGLGGIGDATNVIARPALTAITTVSMDHPDFLGSTVDEIAISKAGILKPGVRGVLNRQTPSVLAMMKARAAKIGASLSARDADWWVERDNGQLHYRDDAGGFTSPLPSLRGSHQTENAGLAIACLRQFPGLKISEAHIIAGLQSAEWPARLQQLEAGPIVDALPAGSQCWLDGGHNEAAGVVLARTMRRWQDTDQRPIKLIMSMLSSKDPATFLEAFQGLPLDIHCIPIPDYDAIIPAGELAEAARGLGFKASAHDSALDAAMAIGRADGGNSIAPIVLICGSLYLAGAILSEHA